MRAQLRALAMVEMEVRVLNHAVVGGTDELQIELVLQGCTEAELL
jgi:hypothetical protein